MSRSAVKDNLKRLEDDNMIARDGLGRKGQTCWRVVVGGPESGGGRNPAGADQYPPPGSASGPEPSIEPSASTSATRARAKMDPDSVPPGFPDDRRPEAREVMTTLRRVVEARGGIPVRANAVGRAMMQNPRKPALAIAQEVEHWAIHGKGQNVQVSDVVARWRRWLVKEPEVVPARPVNGAGPNVVPLRRESYRDQKAREKDERNARRLADLHAMQAGGSVGGVPDVEGTR
jgi:hypothetical protein